MKIAAIAGVALVIASVTTASAQWCPNPSAAFGAAAAANPSPYFGPGFSAGVLAATNAIECRRALRRLHDAELNANRGYPDPRTRMPR
jgi:hypothetical protein